MFSHLTMVPVLLLWPYRRGGLQNTLTHWADSFLFELQSGLRSHVHVQCFHFCMLPSSPRAWLRLTCLPDSLPQSQRALRLEFVGGILLVPKLLGSYEISWLIKNTHNKWNRKEEVVGVEAGKEERRKKEICHVWGSCYILDPILGSLRVKNLKILHPWAFISCPYTDYLSSNFRPTGPCKVPGTNLKQPLDHKIKAWD